jgi:rhodanese-related sulfurtransferase
VTYRDLSPEDVQKELAADPTLKVLDVRTDMEHRMYRLPGSTLLPVQELAQRYGELDPAGNWIIYCEHGRRSLFACEILLQAGFAKLTNLRGGIAHWIGRGLPVQK